MLQRVAQALFLANARVPVRLLLRALWRARVMGLEHIPLRGGVIVAANHTSFADPVVVQSYCPRHLTFLMTEKYYDVPGLHAFVRFWGCLRVKERGLNRAALRAAEGVLARGRAVGIFPEGGVSRDGAIHEALPGIALLAQRADVPVVPAGLGGVERLMPPDTWTFHRAVVTMVVGEAIAPRGGSRDALARGVMEAIRTCAAQARERSSRLS